KAQEAEIEKMEVDEIAAQADFLTVHTPLTPQTKGIVGKDFFQKTKPELKIVNVARGGIIDEDALLEALDEGRAAGVTLDVFEEEPQADMVMLSHPTMVVTHQLVVSTV